MLYYELKLYWMKVCWLYEKTINYFFTFVPKRKKFSNHLKIHCGYLEIETIVSCLFFNHTNEYKVMNNYIVQENLIFSNLDDVNNFLAICMRYFDV